MNASVISLGCAKNLVDSERILAILKEYGFGLVADVDAADILIVNTCGFIAAAKEESVDAIIACVGRKRQNCRCLVVCGCLVQKYEAELRAEIPEVDLWLTTLNFETIGAELARRFPEVGAPKAPYDFRRVLTTPSHWAYLKIAEGCDNRCTFCAIPEMRGPYVSRPIEEIVAEAEDLVKQGVKEIDLLAQDTTAYGRDLYGEPRLKELLRALVKTDVVRLRLFYSYPERIDRELLELMRDEEKICNYLDIPMQHVNDEVLKAMGRPERREKLKALLAMIRDVDPDFAIRSTFIVGFPGESEEAFAELRDFLGEAGLDWVGVFAYSREENTVAYDLPDQIDEATKEARREELMALLSRVSADRLAGRVGRKEEILIEAATDPAEPIANAYPFVGRCAFQGPEVDGVTYVAAKDLSPGDIVTATITGADVYDLLATV